MGGLGKLMPWTAVFTLVGSMGLSALPLTGGFVGEWLALQSFVTLAGSSEGQGLRLLGALAFVLFGLASALAVGCFVRLYGVVFLGRNRSRLVERAHESDWSMRLGMGLAAILVLLLGIVPGPVVAVLQTAVQNQQTLGAVLRYAEGLVVWQRKLCSLCTVTAIDSIVGCFTGCGPYDLRR